jgi:endo-1,4-beta-xylanase
MRNRALLVLICSHLISMVWPQASARTEETPQLKIQAQIPSLRESLSPYFLVGAAIRLADISGPHSELLKKHFNSITAENAMKWASLEPSPGQLDFTVADALVGFAKANGMRVRGHNLVWHKQVPAWVFENKDGTDLPPTAESKVLLLHRLEKHVREVVTHFKGEVYAWDVVNEPIDPTEPDGFRRSRWFELTGTEYIDTAFRVAHEVDPRAKLYLNEYDTTDPIKRAFLLKLVRDLRARGIPLDGVGHQMHSNIAVPSADAMAETIRMFSQLGIDNQIKELDMSLYTDPKERDLGPLKPLLVRQGYRYGEFFRVFRELKGHISSVTFWGIADDHTWLSNHPIRREDFPLLFDRELQAKYAYWGIVDLAKMPNMPPARSRVRSRSASVH